LNKNLLGYKLQIKGRINNSKRKRKLVFQEGKIPLNSLEKSIQQTFDEFKTKSGICSIKMWFYYNDFNVRKPSNYILENNLLPLKTKTTNPVKKLAKKPYNKKNQVSNYDSKLFNERLFAKREKIKKPFPKKLFYKKTKVKK
jgi:ribosomal protein S3